jgi:hypothetical protein
MILAVMQSWPAETDPFFQGVVSRQHDIDNRQFKVSCLQLVFFVVTLCNLSYARAMRTYQVEPLGDRFCVVMTLPDGSKTIIGSFSTDEEAQQWINTLAARSNLNGQSESSRDP